MKLTGDSKKQAEKKSLIENAGMLLTDDELGQVNGGAGGAGYYLKVGNCGAYLALRPTPSYDEHHELAQLYNGCQVFTYGNTERGIGENGVTCTYAYVSFNGIWGWADSAYLSRE